MLRLLVLISLPGVIALALPARVEAEACRSDLDASEGDDRAFEAGHALASPMLDEATAQPPLPAPREPLSWCETPDDPQCTPASAPSEGARAAGALLATLVGLHEVEAPRGTDVPRPRFTERGPRDAVRGLPFRPPR